MLALPTDLHRIDCVAFSPCGRFIAAGGVGVELWDRSFDRVWRHGWEATPYTARVVDLHFHAEGQFLVVQTTASNAPLLWLRVADAMADPVELTSLTWQRVLGVAATSTDHRVSLSTCIDLISWDSPSHARANRTKPQWTVGGTFASPMVQLPTEELLTLDLMPINNPTFGIRNPANGELVRSVPVRYRKLESLRVSDDGQYLAACRNNTVVVWELAQLRRPPRVLTNSTPKAITDVAFHPAGRRWATASNDRVVTIWDTPGWQPIRAYDWHGGRMRSIAFSPDGCLVAVGTDSGHLVVFDWDE